MSDALGLFGDYDKVKPNIADVNPMTHEVSEVKAQPDIIDINPLDTFKEIAEKHGIELNKPNPKCKRCYGRGVEYIQHPGEITAFPKACSCITKNHEKRMKQVMEDVQILEAAKKRMKK